MGWEVYADGPGASCWSGCRGVPAAPHPRHRERLGLAGRRSTADGEVARQGAHRLPGAAPGRVRRGGRRGACRSTATSPGRCWTTSSGRYGYDKRFGLVHVDYATQRRTMRRAAPLRRPDPRPPAAYRAADALPVSRRRSAGPPRSPGPAARDSEGRPPAGSAEPPSCTQPRRLTLPVGDPVDVSAAARPLDEERLATVEGAHPRADRRVRTKRSLGARRLPLADRPVRGVPGRRRDRQYGGRRSHQADAPRRRAPAHHDVAPDHFAGRPSRWAKVEGGGPGRCSGCAPGVWPVLFRIPASLEAVRARSPSRRCVEASAWQDQRAAVRPVRPLRRSRPASPGPPRRQHADRAVQPVCVDACRVATFLPTALTNTFENLLYLRSLASSYRCPHADQGRGPCGRRNWRGHPAGPAGRPRRQRPPRRGRQLHQQARARLRRPASTCWATTPSSSRPARARPRRGRRPSGRTCCGGGGDGTLGARRAAAAPPRHSARPCRWAPPTTSPTPSSVPARPRPGRRRA